MRLGRRLGGDTFSFQEPAMSEGQRPPSRLPLSRWTRVYGGPLRETFPVEESPADDFMHLLEHADRRRSQGDNSPEGAGD